MLHLVRCDVSKAFIPQLIPQHLTASWDWEVGHVRNVTMEEKATDQEFLAMETFLKGDKTPWGKEHILLHSSEAAKSVFIVTWQLSIGSNPYFCFTYEVTSPSECLYQGDTEASSQGLLLIWCIWSKMLRRICWSIWHAQQGYASSKVLSDILWCVALSLCWHCPKTTTGTWEFY